MMSLFALGNSISPPEVTHISEHGVWLFYDQSEYFLPFSDFPWFKKASIGQILNFSEISPGHFYWPDLDVDLGIESIKNPAHFPLRAAV